MVGFMTLIPNFYNPTTQYIIVVFHQCVKDPYIYFHWKFMKFTGKDTIFNILLVAANKMSIYTEDNVFP